MNGHFVSSSSHIILIVMALEAFIADGAIAGENGDVDGNRAIEVTAIHLLEWLFRSGPEPVPCAARELSRGLPDSGQTTCFTPAPPGFFGEEVFCDHPEACPGQDGAIETGCPSDDRFTDNGDGTVTDTCTGLAEGPGGRRREWADHDSGGCPGLVPVPEVLRGPHARGPR